MDLIDPRQGISFSLSLSLSVDYVTRLQVDNTHTHIIYLHFPIYISSVFTTFISSYYSCEFI